MGNITTIGAACLLVLASACGGGGPAGVSAPPIEVSNAEYTSHLTLVSSQPADGAIQVDPGAPLVLQFDGAVSIQSLFDGDTWLRIEGDDQDIPGTFFTGPQAGQVTFTPLASLLSSTRYTLQLSALTADSNWRLLDEKVRITFRTLDNESPRVGPAASTLDGSSAVDRDAPLEVIFSEPLDPITVCCSSVALVDHTDAPWPVVASSDGAVVRVTPEIPLPGASAFTLRIQGGPTGVMDEVGNALNSTWEASFVTEADGTAPLPAEAWPGLTGTTTNVAPEASLWIRFDDAIDQNSAVAAVTLEDPSNNPVAHTRHWSSDRKTLAVTPNSPLNGSGTFALRVSTGLADISGNPLAAPLTAQFTLGADTADPVLQRTRPVDGEQRATPHAVLEADFSEPLAGHSVTLASVTLVDGDGTPVAGTAALEDSNRRIVFDPAAPLDVSTDYTFTVVGGALGVTDLAGNPLPSDLTVSFRTSGDPVDPVFVSSPLHGLTNLPRNAKLTVRFEEPLDPTTVDALRVEVRYDSTALAGTTLQLSPDQQTITVYPVGNWWTSNLWHNLTLKGGPDGIRMASGNWLIGDQLVRFYTSNGSDTVPPVVSVTVNDIPAQRNTNLTLPPAGFTVDVVATDLYGAVDRSSVDFRLTSRSGADAPHAEDIADDLVFGASTITWRVPADHALPLGEWTLNVVVDDLAGNRTVAGPLEFRVAPADSGVLPFERTQVCHVRFDLDRDGNGRADFEDELLLLGLITDGDPIGTNAYMIQLMRDGVLARMNQIFGRSPTGDPLDENSVPIRLVTTAPAGIAAMSIHIGGFEPGSDTSRTYGDESTGILGRAWYDYRNANQADDNTGMSPGLGVFGAEMYLYQAGLHDQVYPWYTTTFGNRFIHTSPPMGGDSAGAHSEDPAVLRSDFNYDAGSTAERTRYTLVMLAADDWCAAIGTIGAHEVAHSLGLVAPGDTPLGLFGDAGLHNSSSNLTDVMAASVSYASMVTNTYAFRPLNLAYLRQRILLR